VYRRSDGTRAALNCREYTFFIGAGNEGHQLGIGCFMHKRIISAVRRVEFVSDRMSYIILRGRWCNIVNMYTPCKDTSDDIKNSIYEKIGRVFDQFPRYDTKILLGDFNAKVGREDIFKPTIGNESSHEINNDNGVRVVNFATSKNLVVKSTMFPYCSIHKYTWTSPDGKRQPDRSHFDR
jgi:hypothetical protein